ncbi:intein C-terminal splicing region/intein N-terminal splicing region/RHS repeat-associated core domain-containing protein [Paenibacillus aquistagni]|uniref:Intein C-terminal splicing region/intein N-terminal splicing region/RHS repeat-associated core domain-containing protein n=1 Tax=Paenibacillus aquistagni TaxID=1852522 RepID=A0A1X7LGL7_9BACL|nr:intein C-terminal splicing region/intein N-terminal splicing region/RHS repeat-associated core domain-containing protein [Paenibacillus aquistagni]
MSYHYTYSGNKLTRLSQQVGDVNASQYDYKHDGNGNIVFRTQNGHSESYTYDFLSRIIGTSGGDQYKYDVQLIQVKKKEVDVKYKYNGDGLLVERESNGGITRYYYDGSNIIAEADIVDGEPVFKARYIRGNRLEQIEYADGKKASVSVNGHGDVTELRDEQGNLLNEYTYDIWGNPLATQETVHNPFRYSGELWDEDTELQYLRARWYDPSVGRFITEDSYKGELNDPQTLYLYAYVANNPLKYIDFSGHDYELPSSSRFRELAQNNAYVGMLDFFRTSFKINQHSGYDGLLNPAAAENLRLLKAGYRDSSDSNIQKVMEIQGLALRNDACSYLVGGCQGGSALITGQGDGYFNISLSNGTSKTNYTVTKTGTYECNCFTAGTKILTKNGEKAIEEIAVGDMVLEKDDLTGDIAYKEVLGLFQKKANEIYYIHVGEEVIEVTGEHPFWLNDVGWTLVKNLKVGDLLVASDGSTKSIEQINKAEVHTTVYNFEVKDYNSYFVSNLGLWVHNCTVTEGMIRSALGNADLKAQQVAVSLPVIQAYVDMALRGQTAPAIKVDNGILVDGYHRYIAGLVIGQIPAYRPYSGGRPSQVIPWEKLRIDPEDWGNR